MRGNRKPEVARLAGVSEGQVSEVSVAEVRSALADRVSSVVLAVATQDSATYWRVGGGGGTTHYFLDDPEFGDVEDFAGLDYNSDIGLHATKRS